MSAWLTPSRLTTPLTKPPGNAHVSGPMCFLPACLAGYATLESMPHVADSHNGTNGNSAAHHNGHSNDHSPSGSSKGPSSNCHRAGSNGNGHAYSYMYSSASSGNGFAASTNGNGHSASGSPSSSYDQIERPRYPPFDAHVHGVLYKLKVEDLDKLSKKEGGYVLKDFEVCISMFPFVSN